MHSIALIIVLHNILVYSEGFSIPLMGRPYCNENINKIQIVETKINGSCSNTIGSSFIPKLTYKSAHNCCPGYFKTVSNTCEPICEVPCLNHSFCAAPNQCRCKVGYSKQHPIDECAPVCNPTCGDNADCVAPNICECRIGYIQIGNRCETICSKAYRWNSTTENCESRCKWGAIWDPISQNCAQKIIANVQLIAAQMNIHASSTVGEGDNNFEDPTSDSTKTATTIDRNSEDNEVNSVDLVAAVEGANETTEENDNDDDYVDISMWFERYIHVLVFLLIIMPLMIGALTWYLWKVRPRRRHEIEVFEVKNDFYTEYALDRSRIMVY